MSSHSAARSLAGWTNRNHTEDNLHGSPYNSKVLVDIVQLTSGHHTMQYILQLNTMSARASTGGYRAIDNEWPYDTIFYKPKTTTTGDTEQLTWVTKWGHGWPAVNVWDKHRKLGTITTLAHLCWAWLTSTRAPLVIELIIINYWIQLLITVEVVSMNGVNGKDAHRH